MPRSVLAAVAPGPSYAQRQPQGEQRCPGNNRQAPSAHRPIRSCDTFSCLARSEFRGRPELSAAVVGNAMLCKIPGTPAINTAVIPCDLDVERALRHREEQRDHTQRPGCHFAHVEKSPAEPGIVGRNLNTLILLSQLVHPTAPVS
jgi:hypothetical protein